MASTRQDSDSPVLDEKFAPSPNPSDVEKGSTSVIESREEVPDLAYVVDPEAERRYSKRTRTILGTCEY